MTTKGYFQTPKGRTERAARRAHRRWKARRDAQLTSSAFVLDQVEGLGPTFGAPVWALEGVAP